MDETQTHVDTTQQVTLKVPTTIVCFKNPKRVAAGKANAEKARQAREAQKQKLAEADIIIANERLKKAQEEAKKKVDESPPSATPAATPSATPSATPETMQPPDKEAVSQTLSTTQWLSVIAIGVSMVGVYYNRQALKNCFYKIKAPASNTQKAPASSNTQTAPASATKLAPEVDKPPKKKFGIQTMA